MPTTDLTPGTITTLGQLRPGDVGEWLDCNKRFVCTRLHSYPGFGLCFDAAYEGGGGISEPWLDRPVRYLGRGRIEPARIVMDGEPDRAAELEAGLPWTDAKPTVPGWYWYRDDVSDHRESWAMLEYRNDETVYDEGFSHPVDEFAGQFAGPIPHPEEPR